MSSNEEKILTLVPELRPIARDHIFACDQYFASHDEGGAWQGCTTVVTQAKRDIYYQAGLYSIGRRWDQTADHWIEVDPRQIVTWTLVSKHLDGKAYDIAIKMPGGQVIWPSAKIPLNKAMWVHLAELGRQLGLYPGAFWTHREPDYPHYSLEKE